MNVQLVEGDLDAFLVESGLDSLENVEVDRPVVSAVDPYTSYDVNAACAVSANAYKDGLILEDELMGVADVGDDLLCLFKVVAVADREGKVYSASILFGVVDDSAGGESSVGDVNHLVVAGANASAGDVNVFNDAAMTLCLYEVVDSEGTSDYNENAACKVRNRSVNGETDTYAEGGYECGKSGGVNSYVANKADGNDYLHSKLENVSQNLCDSLIQFALFVGSFDLLAYKVNYLKGDDKKNESNKQLDAYVETPAYNGV